MCGVELALGADHSRMDDRCMDTIWNLEWRLLPAAVVAVMGLAMAFRGDALLVRGLHLPVQSPGKNLLSMRGLRLVLLGLSIVAVGAGWYLHWPAMVAAGFVIGFEETIETSIAAWALAHEEE